MRGSEVLDHVAVDTRNLVTEPKPRRALDKMNAMGTVRDAIQHEADDEVDGATLKQALRVAEQIVTLGAAYLRDQRPGPGLPEPGREGPSDRI